jgi:hypothetical protein
MKNPFYITDELTLSRTEIVTTNHEELLKKISPTYPNYPGWPTYTTYPNSPYPSTCSQV